MAKPSAFLLICVTLLYFMSFSGLKANPIDQESLNELPHVIRQSPSPLLNAQVINGSLDDVQLDDVTVNVTNTSLSDIENDNITHSLQLQHRERKKQERLVIIQAQILHSLGMDRQPNISSSVISEEQRRKFALFFETVHNGHNGGPLELSSEGISSSYLSKLQSFYPACEPPHSCDRSLWESDDTFRIYYDAPITRQPTTSDMTITLAKLRLYKIADNYIEWSPNQENLPRYNQLELLINNNAANSINVNVYQFMKPIRSNKKEKRRLIDTRTIFNEYQGWVEFNVINALKYWLHHPNKNFGFDIQVEDAFGNRQNPNLYFQNINCTEGMPQEPPFPNIMEVHPEMLDNESTLFDNEVYPTLDLQTAELQKDLPDLLLNYSSRTNNRKVKKRSTKKDDAAACHGVQEYVTFAEMALDGYIIWPVGVMWTFCEGECTKNENVLNKELSFYRTWMEKIFSLNPTPVNSSCVATSKESLTVILIIDGDGFESVVEDIIPTSCGCRST